MIIINKPIVRPSNIHFSSGPCSKHPNWSFDLLKNASLGRSHRSKECKIKLNLAINLTREILKIPIDYKIGIVPGSDTGAIEMALWSMLGLRNIDMLQWEKFGSDWTLDVIDQLKLNNVTIHKANYGELPDLTKVNFDNDVVFVWNGTTSGVCIPNDNWIPNNHKGLVFCDATSAVFANYLPWNKLDVVTYSWQKVLGGEGAHGMIILSPNAINRLLSYRPIWPLPKIFRLTKNGKLLNNIFKGNTINTPSMLAVEDYLNALNWVKQIGGLDAMVQRANDNLMIFIDWVKKTSWVDFLPKIKTTYSNTSVCIKIIDPDIISLSLIKQISFVKKISLLLNNENIAKDIDSYKEAPIGLRIWIGSTIEQSDLKALVLWLDWAFITTKTYFKYYS